MGATFAGLDLEPLASPLLGRGGVSAISMMSPPGDGEACDCDVGSAFTSSSRLAGLPAELPGHCKSRCRLMSSCGICLEQMGHATRSDSSATYTDASPWG